MTRHPKLCYIALFLVTFCVSFTILWERQGRVVRQPVAMLADRNIVRADDAMPSPKLPSQPIEQDGATKQPATAAPIPPATPSQATSSQATLEPLPVSLQIVHNHRMQRIEAFISNLSNTLLSIEVGILDSSGAPTSSFSIDLEPQAARTFGMDEGMVLIADEQITLTSAGYQPQSKLVP